MSATTRMQSSRSTGYRSATKFPPHEPPVPINKTIRPDYIISLEDGRQYKSMKPIYRAEASPRSSSKEVGFTTRLSDGRGQLRQNLIRVGEGDWPRPKRKGRKRGARKIPPREASTTPLL